MGLPSMFTAALALALTASPAVGAPAPSRRGRGFGLPRACPTGGCTYTPPSHNGSRPGTQNCSVHYIRQPLDHFSRGGGEGVYSQRYFMHDGFWAKGADGGMGPIFFYLGNEAPVDTYVNATGLMWESAAEFGALLVFAEHRFYGTSQPTATRPDGSQDMSYLSHEQALADYASLIYVLRKRPGAAHSPVIGFGGSYGGMLAAWMRQKYPAALDGAIAASAPIKAFAGMVPRFDSESYWAVVTRDASLEGGSAPACAGNVRAAWEAIDAAGQSQLGRDELAKVFQTCGPLRAEPDVGRLKLALKFAWDTMAMGNYPYPDSYLTGGGPAMPAWPVRAACAHLAKDLTAPEDTRALLEGMLAAAGVYNNASRAEPCLALPEDLEEDGIWDYQWCTESLPQETYFACDGERDMFWPQPEDPAFVAARCRQLWGVTPRPEWIAASYGREGLPGASNIVFSNGGYDPWSSGGVLEDLSDTVVAVTIPTGAHHLDLFFSHPDDPPAVAMARAEERAHMRRWVAEARGRGRRVL